MELNKVSPRNPELDWDECFMGIAKILSLRSKYPSSQVGACIVSQDHRILSVGYNGTPNSIDDKDINWSSENDDIMEIKNTWVVHAELNAILNFRGNTKDLEGSSIYVTFIPCIDCVKAIAQVGIKTVYYEELRKKFMNSLSILDKCGIEAIHLKKRKDILI